MASLSSPLLPPAPLFPWCCKPSLSPVSSARPPIAGFGDSVRLGVDVPVTSRGLPFYPLCRCPLAWRRALGRCQLGALRGEIRQASRRRIRLLWEWIHPSPGLLVRLALIPRSSLLRCPIPSPLRDGHRTASSLIRDFFYFVSITVPYVEAW
ncbi:hypothetical protein BS78_K274900 [Paspalum vaginatum]|uniref:Uncharacterized protein n=1 Tax=Paspalum vaginatum TaxID=158149 RepID=A0A9W7XD14_9POAL|nr:hypothetical protein BS78_K274900 [Paspalum vaginatum]